MSRSEFPETRYSKIGKRIGWIFSPILLIALIIFTLALAEGLQIDFSSRSIEKKSSVEIKDIKNAEVYIDDKDIGKTPLIQDIPSHTNSDIKVLKDGRKTWVKSVKPAPGFVKTYYPVLFPNNLDLNSTKPLNTNNVYYNKYTNIFFYDKQENNKLLIRKYSVSEQIFGSNIKDEPFADITSFVTSLEPKPSPTPTNATVSPAAVSAPTPLTFKDYKITPSNNGKSLLLVINNEKVLILNEGGEIVSLPNIIPKKDDSFTWSPNDSYIIYKTGQEIYSIQISSGKTLVVFKPQSDKEKSEIQFYLESGLIYKVQNDNFIDLIQTPYEGINSQKIELPNIDGIRKDNLVKAYDLIKKQNIILIQTKDNIYSYNVITFNIKIVNRFKGEEIVFVDPEKLRVVTINKTNKNQFIFYDMEEKEKKSFTLKNADENTKPKDVWGYNGSQNLGLVYENKIIFVDIDGANELQFTDLNNPELVLLGKVDNNIHIIIKESVKAPATQGITNPYKYNINLGKFEN